MDVSAHNNKIEIGKKEAFNVFGIFLTTMIFISQQNRTIGI